MNEPRVLEPAWGFAILHCLQIWISASLKVQNNKQ